MNRFAKRSAIAFVLAGVVGTSVAAGAVSSAAGQGKEHVIRLVPSRLETHETQPDHFVGAERLRSLATHQIVGYDSFFGVVNPQTNELSNWQGFSLEGGVIDWFVHTPLSKTTFSGPITHGSGTFKGIKGTISVQPIPNTTKVVYILRYRL